MWFPFCNSSNLLASFHQSLILFSNLLFKNTSLILVLFHLFSDFCFMQSLSTITMPIAVFYKLFRSVRFFGSMFSLALVTFPISIYFSSIQHSSSWVAVCPPPCIPQSLSWPSLQLNSFLDHHMPRLLWILQIYINLHYINQSFLKTTLKSFLCSSLLPISSHILLLLIFTSLSWQHKT